MLIVPYLLSFIMCYVQYFRFVYWVEYPVCLILKYYAKSQLRRRYRSNSKGMVEYGNGTLSFKCNLLLNDITI